MSDLISREALVKQFDERLDSAHIQCLTRRTGKILWNGIAIGINWGRNTILEAPAVDAVEVVRCRECQYCDTSSFGGRYCSLWDVDDYEEAFVEDDDFCSKGERRSE